SIVPGALQDRLEAVVDVDAPARGDRVADHRDPERANGLVGRVFAVAHALRVGDPADAAALGRVGGPERDLAEVVDADDQRGRVDRGGEGPPGATAAAQGREVAQVVESLAVAEELLVGAALDPRRVRAVEKAARNAG